MTSTVMSTMARAATRTTLFLQATTTETRLGDFASESTAMLSYLQSIASSSPTAVYDGDPPPIETSATDPYLEVLPAFMYSLPVQIICTGVTVTLLGVLAAHLLFTIRYHWPLSKLNYSLQTGSVLIWTCIVSYHLAYIFTKLWNDTRQWPFIFEYIEIDIPPQDWKDWQLGIWYTVQAASNFAVHATHIQFLTLLFPSGLEKKLVLSFLGPLAFISSFLYYTGLAKQPAVQDLGDAIRNTANSSLTLLYTLALFIWGIFLNRNRAWRTDGGTAAFGIMALFLGICSTTINFYEVSEDRMRWLPGLIACGLLWQSWVGFWWWVGAGMWTGEANDIERRERKKAKRAEKKRLKAERKAGKRNADVAMTANTASSTGQQTKSNPTASSRLFRRRTTANSTNAAAGEEVELQTMGVSSVPPTPTTTGTTAGGGPGRPGTGSGTGSGGRETHSTPGDSLSSGSTSHYPRLVAPLYRFFRPWLSHLREAHDAAALERAAEPSALPESVRRSWGLQALTVQGRREREATAARRATAAASFRPPPSSSSSAAAGQASARHGAPSGPREALRASQQQRRMAEEAVEGESGPRATNAGDAFGPATANRDDPSARRAEFIVDGGQRLEDEDDDDDDDGDDVAGEAGPRRDGSGPRAQGAQGGDGSTAAHHPPVWRRAVNRWRLKDVSDF